MTVWGEIVVSRNGRVLRRRHLSFLNKELSMATEATVTAGTGWSIATPFKWVGAKIAAFARAVWNWRATAAIRHAISTVINVVRKGFSKLGRIGTGAAAVAIATSHTGQKIVRGIAKGLNKTVRFLCRAITWPLTLLPGNKVKDFQAKCGRGADNLGAKIWESAAVVKVRGWMNPERRAVRLVRDGAAATAVAMGAIAVGGIAAVIGIVLAVGYVAVRLANEFGGKKAEPTPPEGEFVEVITPEGQHITVPVADEAPAPKAWRAAEPVVKIAEPVARLSQEEEFEIAVQVTMATTDLATTVVKALQADPLKNRSRPAKDAYASAKQASLQREATAIFRRIMVNTKAGDAANGFLELALKAYANNDLPQLELEGSSEELHAALMERAAHTVTAYAQFQRINVDGARPKATASAAS
jgi:hypothetical protein